MANDQEIEVKFYVRDLPGLERRLQALGARLSQPRVHEMNLRFDTPDRALTAAKRVLRLRKDIRDVLTYKGPSQARLDVAARQEIEFAVSDFDAARRFLEALGYEVSVSYEKYRATYALDNLLVTLDEMPYGSFAEIEGPDAGQIQAAAAKLGLNWEMRITDSYLALFDRLRVALALDVHDLSFANFEGITVTPDNLGVKPGD